MIYLDVVQELKRILKMLKKTEMIDLRFKKLSTEFLDVIISLEKEFLSAGLDK